MLPLQFNVMPVKDKKPLVRWTDLIEREQTSEEKMAVLKAAIPGMVGIVCGPVSRIFVLDIDGKQGEDTIRPYHIPRTWSVKTPHGKHYYFKWVKELDNKVTTKVDIIPNKANPDKSGGVDVRGEGGYVVFYGWERGPNVSALMAPPQWLIDLLPNKGSTRIIGDTFKKLDYVQALENLREGNRNDTFTRLAGGLRAKGFEFNEIYAFLSPKAKEIGFEDNELRMVCGSVCRYPAGQRPPIQEIHISDNFEQFIQDTATVDYLVPGVFAKSSISFVAGLSETCKTWTLTDLAIELARKDGGMWLGRFPTRHGKVLYVDQERIKAETVRRFRALIEAKNLDPKELNDSLVIRSGTAIRLNLQQSFDAFRSLLAKVRPEAVLVDSYKTFHTYDVNSNVQMQEVMERVKELRNEFGCTFVFIYHENKGAFERIDSKGNKKQVTFEHMAGAMVMSEVAETIMITVKQDQDSSFLHHVKNTYGQKVAPALVSVENVTPDKKKIRVVAR